MRQQKDRELAEEDPLGLLQELNGEQADDQANQDKSLSHLSVEDADLSS